MENISQKYLNSFVPKLSGFLMFSGGREEVHLEQMR